MRGHAVDGDVDPGESAVRNHQLQPGWLDHDRGIGAEAAQNLLCAGAGELLVGDEGEDDIPAQRLLRRGDGGDHARGDPALHVEAAATEDLAVLAHRRQPIAVVAGKRNRVDVPVEHDALTAAGTGCDGDDGWPARARFESMAGKPAGSEPGADEVSDPALPRGIGDQVGVRGVTTDQLLEQVGDIIRRHGGNTQRRRFGRHNRPGRGGRLGGVSIRVQRIGSSIFGIDEQNDRISIDVRISMDVEGFASSRFEFM